MTGDLLRSAAEAISPEPKPTESPLNETKTKINQFQSKELIPDNATGCRANELDSYKFIPVQLSNDEVHLLTL